MGVYLHKILMGKKNVLYGEIFNINIHPESQSRLFFVLR